MVILIDGMVLIQMMVEIRMNMMVVQRVIQRQMVMKVGTSLLMANMMRIVVVMIAMNLCPLHQVHNE